MASMTTDLLNRILFWKKRDPSSGQVENASDEITKWDSVVIHIKNIIIWKNPVISLLCLICVNFLFWLLIYIDIRFYGMIFIALLIVSVNQLWNEYSQPSVKMLDADPGRGSAQPSGDDRMLLSDGSNRYFSKTCELIKTGYFKLKRLRREQPGTFCIVTCISFLMLSFIGRTVSDVTFLYILFMGILIVPGIFTHFVPPHIVNSVINLVHSSQKEEEIDKEEEEDYLLDANEENLELLRKAADLHLTPRDDQESSNDFLLEQMSARTNDTESTVSKMSFYPESSLPSVMDENSLDFSELETVDGAETKRNESDESDGGDINFQSKHFNGDTSDEENFSKGLDFAVKEKTKKRETEPPQQNLLNVADIGYNLLSVGANLLLAKGKSTPAPEVDRTDRGSSSDTDSFELISEEDI